MGATEGIKKGSIFLCPGSCEQCALSSKECPSRGELDSRSSDSEMGMGEFLSEVILPRMKQSILEKVSPETIVKIHESELFRLAQYCEIMEQAGEEKITLQELEERILALTPAVKLSNHSKAIKERFVSSVRIIASKLIEIKQRACQDQGIACQKCYMHNICLQYDANK